MGRPAPIAPGPEANTVVWQGVAGKSPSHNSQDPCRWSVENDFEFMPFGVGRRLCLGYNLALENLQLFVASLFCSFRFSTEGGAPVSMTEVTEFTVSLPQFKASPHRPEL